MEKINGYAAAEARELIEDIAEGKRAGKSLTSLFAAYGRRHNRASGSVRNYYYKLLHSPEENARALLAGKHLRAAQVAPFTEHETEQMLESILTECAKGCSVRRAIGNVCGDDAKKALRYQNKYRNLLKKQPERIGAAAQRLGLPVLTPRSSKSMLERRLESEINALYDRLALSLRAENDELRRTVRKLTEENELLRRASRTPNAGRTADGA